MNRFRGMFVVFSIALYFSFVFSLFTGISIGIDKIPWIKNISWLFILVNKLLLFVTIILTIYIGICLLFKYAPRFKLKWKQIHPGAVIATIPTSLFLMLFTTITTYALDYSTIGGNLSYFMTMSMSLLVFATWIL
jgi:membrane protein